ncbi:ExeM/NucH family extracellular endonuclease [Microbacterium enclense]|uniref:ExeM/NucH family extracellular endonuclease n=1 Tax=Microbacterium enclense TaxID=993073 RepID=A0A443JP03_9MICO|nr:ExeM/NucH family extracellular endonuclease [Microbacterium enclense]RWR22232.1 ExeM/NucH family extracellular endonuclease [Microbacterium enclense]
MSARPLSMSALSSALAAVIVGALIPLAAVAPAQADTLGTGVVINEAYLKGGSANAAYSKKFVELYNAGGTDVDLSSWSLQYRSASGTGASSGTAALSGTIKARSYFLIQINGNGSTGAALPTPDLDLAGKVSPSGTTGTLFLAKTTTAITAPTGSVTGQSNIADLIGYGSSNTYEGRVVPVTGGNDTPNSLARTTFVDTDDNRSDFTHPASITPQNSSASSPSPSPSPSTSPSTSPTTSPSPSPSPTTPAGSVTPIATIQGTGDSSPLSGQTVTTRGVVTAAYPSGGFAGYYVQTENTGGAIDFATHTASDAVFVYSPTTVGQVAVGDLVQVTGTVSEYFGLTQLTVGSTGLSKVGTGTAAAATVAVPRDAAQRESLEGMLVAPQGDYTVSNTYSTNQYAEIGLASGTKPLITPTEIARPGTAEYTAAVADNTARGIVLDDGASINFLGSATNKAIPLPYLSTKTVSVGAAVTFTRPVVMDYRNNVWKLQPTTQLTVDNDASVSPATFSNVRQPAPAAVGGDIKVATFNVLNYFTTTGDSLSGCSYYTDRAGAPITVNTGCDARGAANATNLKRQQDKIVTAITTLDADVVSLEEIENSAAFGKNRDSALSTLTAALNTAAGSDVWAFVASPSALPASEDVIRTAFIYKKATVRTEGDSRILTTGSAFANARRPLAQKFGLVGKGDDSEFIAIANHFKSKGSGSGVDADQGDGQGASNASRVAQAGDLVSFANGLKSEWGTDRVFLMGDFNAYSKEDPIKVLTDAGYIDQGSKSGKYSYSFSGQSGSLDHVFASQAANQRVRGADVWNINSGESIALEYSRYNYNATNFYDTSAFRSSDHDPVLVGVDLTPTATVNLVDINDFHGRIDANTPQFAGTVEQLRAQYGEANTLFLSSGDNIGASPFASASQDDQPTIDVLNALDLKASAIGNHELDRGFDDLVNRVVGSGPNAKFAYLGANVYQKGTTTPALPEYAITTVAGLRVGVIGTVTQETPALVSPGGISGLDFGDPVEATNRVAAQLTDGNPANGEADIIVAAYHEGAGAGTPDGATLEQEIAAGGPFAEIVTETSAQVDAIFTGHTHKTYAWDAPIPGATDGRTRPVIQTGNYGENIGNVVLTVSDTTGDVLSYTGKNVARTTTTTSTLVATYPRVAQVKTITDAALAAAAQIGNQPVGSVTNDITTAYAGGSYTNGVYTGGSRDDRSKESTLGNLVADSLVTSLSSAERGGAQIGVVNPGGLRADLLYAPDGVISYSEANAVLPFVNNLWTTSLTGAQFKTLLEQQWQTNPDGTVPSRPFLKLGLSKNVAYTFDATRAAGDRITSITVDGAPIDPSTSYRIGSFSFLVQGGDNFRIFTQGTGTKDSGLIDRDAWIDYLKANPGLAPDFARRSVQVTGAPTAPVTATSSLSLAVSGLDLTSKGSPVNTTATVEWTGSSATFAPVTVSGGSANLSLTVPTDAVAASEIVVRAQPSGTVVRIPVSVAVDRDAPRVSLSVSGRTVTVSATDTGSGVSSVEYRLDGGAWTAYDAALVLDDKGHSVEARATDKAGNVSAVASTSLASVDVAEPPVLTARGTARTATVGDTVAPGAVTVADAGGHAMSGVVVTFEVSGPGTFAGGKTSVRVTSDALGLATAPSVTTSAAGAVEVTADAALATEVSLPTITVVAKAPVLTVDGSATAAVVSGKARLTVAVTNTSTETVAVKIKTAYGSKTVASLAPGASTEAVFKTALASLPSGSATLEITGAAGANTVALPYTATR